jgi:hypothetical protein
MPAKADTIEDLFSFRILNYATCAETEPSPTFYSLAFEFADPCVAGVVNHPEHSGEYMLFHLRGFTVAETSVRILLIYNNHVEFVSPPLPVRVTLAGSTPSLALDPGVPGT